jgi:hypothetical protein
MPMMQPVILFPLGKTEPDLFRFVLVFFLFRQARQRDYPFAFFQFD